LNTASAAEIDALPEVGKARTKAIIDERAKGKFKDWADFDKRMSGTSVNAGVKAKIQDLVCGIDTARGFLGSVDAAVIGPAYDPPLDL
jgi:predicted nucleic acid-binding OB-fold protein